MKKTFLLLTVSLLGLALAGCQSRNTITSGVGNPEKIITLPEEVQYDSFYDNVSEYGTLALETNEQSLLGDILKIRVYKGRIFLLNGNSSNGQLLVFDKKTGQFINKIGLQGRGPQEYVNLADFEIDPTRDELLLLDKYGQKILMFDRDGKFKRTVSTPVSTDFVGRLPDGRFVLARVPGPSLGVTAGEEEFFAITICDENGEIVEQLLKNEVDPSLSFRRGSTDMIVPQSDGNLSLMPQYHNTVYRLTDKEITAEFGIEIPGETVTVDILNQVYSDPNSFFNAIQGKNYLLGDHAESDTYLYFKESGGRSVFYNKISGEIIRAYSPFFGLPVFIDDEGFFWGNVTVMSGADDELATFFREAFGTDNNRPLIYYKLKI